MSTMPDDTDAETTEHMSALYASMTPADKLRRVRDLTEMTARLALAGLRARHPDATPRRAARSCARSGRRTTSPVGAASRRRGPARPRARRGHFAKPLGA